jgi:hypothetical protein
VAAEIFAGLCILALGGWAATLVAFARSSLPMANALSVANKVDTLVDERIARTFERIKARRERTAATAPSVTPQGGERRADPMAEVFGTGPLFVPDQPDAEDEGLEVVQA